MTHVILEHELSVHRDNTPSMLGEVTAVELGSCECDSGEGDGDGDAMILFSLTPSSELAGAPVAVLQRTCRLRLPSDPSVHRPSVHPPIDRVRPSAGRGWDGTTAVIATTAAP